MDIIRKRRRTIGRRVLWRVAVVIIIRKITVLLDIETFSLGMKSVAIWSPSSYLEQFLGMLSSYYPRPHQRELTGWKEEDFMSDPMGMPYLIYRSLRGPISLLALSGNCAKESAISSSTQRTTNHPSLQMNEWKTVLGINPPSGERPYRKNINVLWSPLTFTQGGALSRWKEQEYQ